MLKFIILFICLTLSAQDLKLSGAQIPEYDKQGKLKSIMNCKSAVQRNGRLHLYSVTMTLFNDNKSIMKTSQCQYFEVEKQVKGKEKIFLKNKDMDMEGKGFVYDQKKKVLIVLKDVVIYLNHKKGALK